MKCGFSETLTVCYLTSCSDAKFVTSGEHPQERRRPIRGLRQALNIRHNMSSVKIAEIVLKNV